MNARKLLLADDSVTIQKVVSISFANEDVQVITVDNGDDALERAREIVPDVVLADVQMPGRSGYEVCEALKAEPALRHIPVLLLSGTFESFDEERARAVGAAGHVTKPFEAQVLVERVTELLDAPATVEAEPETDDDALDFELLEDEPEADAAGRSGPAVLGRVEPVTVRSRSSEVPVATALEPDDGSAPDAPDATVAVLDEMPPPLPGEASGSGASGTEPAPPAPQAPDWDADEAFDWPTEDGSLAAGDVRAPEMDAEPPPPLPGEPEAGDPGAGYDEIFDFDIERGSAEEAFSATPSGPGTGGDAESPSGSSTSPTPATSSSPSAPSTGWDETLWSPEPAAAVPVTPLAEPWEDPEPPAPGAEATALELEAGDDGRAADTELTAEAVAEPEPGPGDDGTAGVSPALRRELQASLEKVAWDAFGDLSERIVKEVMARVEAVAWEVIPQMAETLIREEIQRLKDGGGETR